jgi:hypothetical protein
MKYLLCLPMLMLVACQNYPRDTAGTLDRVHADHVIRVGLIAGEAEARDRARIAAYLDRVGKATGARPVVTRGAAEPLLLRLDQGALDLVIGDMSETTPWATDVMVIEPIGDTMIGKERVLLSPIARNGENQWIMLLERAVRDGSGA